MTWLYVSGWCISGWIGCYLAWLDNYRYKCRDWEFNKNKKSSLQQPAKCPTYGGLLLILFGGLIAGGIIFLAAMCVAAMNFLDKNREKIYESRIVKLLRTPICR